MGITVLSLFDGISCGQIALERAGIKVDRYYASEIKKCAIETTMRNYPGTIQIGDVRKAWYNDGILHTENGDFNVGKIDLLIGGSPCQNFSIARVSMGTKEIEGLNGEKSRYFIKQKAYGLAMLAVTVLAAWATEGDITIAVITVPLGLMCLFSKKMLIVDNYYFATEERAIHGRKNNTAY